MSSILIRSARVLSPADGIDRVMNVYIEDGVIAELDSARTVAGRVIDAAGLKPSLFDKLVSTNTTISLGSCEDGKEDKR